LIVADDLGYAELGCYGQKKIRTPSVDRLAAEGIRLTRFYAGSPVCAPSRCTLMTGKHTGHSWVRDNRSVPPEGQTPIPDAEITLAEILKSQGYATGAMGKWGLGFPGSEGEPLNQGFDHFYGYNCQAHAHNHYPTYLWNDREKVKLAGNPGGSTGAQFSHDLFEAEALKFMREHKDGPFFLFLPFTISHLAIQVPEDSLAEYRGLWDDPAYDGKKGYQPHPAPRAGYAAMVTRMDRTVGRIAALIGELGIDGDTIVAFMSDNGPTYDRIGGSDSAFFESAGGLRGLKGSVYEGGIRVPLVVRWPGRIKPGSVSDLPAYLPDLFPTVLDLVGLSDHLPKGLDGVSLAPTLLGRPAEQRRHEFLYWEFPSYGGQQAVRLGDWKGVRQNLAKGKTRLELYDLTADRAERRDVAAGHPEVVARIERILREQHTRSDLFPLQAIDAPASGRE
jgi:arylsulfatase